MRVLNEKEMDEVSGGSRGSEGYRFIPTSYPLSRLEKLEIVASAAVGPTRRQIEINRLREAGNTDPSALADALGL